MDMLGVMVDATCALYGMELDYVHRPVAGRANCRLVKWTESSLTRICWDDSGEGCVHFHTCIHLPDAIADDDAARFADGLSEAVPVTDGQLPFVRTVRLEQDDLVVESSVVIRDASYVGEVEQAYMQALQEIMAIEGALPVHS